MSIGISPLVRILWPYIIGFIGNIINFNNQTFLMAWNVRPLTLHDIENEELKIEIDELVEEYKVDLGSLFSFLLYFSIHN